MLAGLTRCALCGGTMVRVNKTSKKKGGRTYLVCTAAKAGAGCVYHAVPQEDVEAALIEASKEFQADVPGTDASYNDRASEIDAKSSAAEEAVENLLQEIRERGSSPQLRKELDRAEAEMEEWGRKSHAFYREATQGSERLLRDNLELAWSTLSAPSPDVVKVNAMLRRIFAHAVIDWRFGSIALHWRHMPEASMRVRYANVLRPRVVRGPAPAA